ncbi:MAG: menaquinone biosynthetic enzyme MqnA/MqnD family protein [Bryobacteraceae bacterium]
MTRPRVCSVDFLNSAPLVWGLLHGPQQGLFDLSFRVPSECAGRVASGEADIGNLPVIEIARQNLSMVRGVGVAARGPVRSILLVSKRPLDQVRTLAADSSSRTSVELARVVLSRRYAACPAIRAHAPDVEAMLRDSDAALIIGDPALRLDPGALPYRVADLGAEWMEMTGLPMVFAAWAGEAASITPDASRALVESCRYGRERLDEVIAAESAARRIPEPLAREYLERHIVNELDERDYAGLELFLKLAQ